jgi:hypothetical protein
MNMRCARAVATARLAVGDGGGTMADAPARTNTVLYTDADPMADAAFCKNGLLEIDAFCRDARALCGLSDPRARHTKKL